MKMLIELKMHEIDNYNKTIAYNFNNTFYE